jgi:hypothetical protein
MTEEIEDWEAWDKYPQHRWVFNKMELALRLGYCAGPTPGPVPTTGEYIVRPIYNFSGMAAGAKIMTLEQGKVYDFQPSYFWCERFYGEHLSVDYVWIDSEITPVHSSVGDTDFENLSRFSRWYEVEHRKIDLPAWINNFRDIGKLNIEFVGGKIIEIHLRHGDYFPEGTTEIIPVWSTTSKQEIDKLLEQGYTYEDSYMDAEKNISDPRLGFLWK